MGAPNSRAHNLCLLIDELLAPYGKEMTWDIKAGLMGKRKSHDIAS